MTEDPVGDALLNLEHSLIQVDAARHTLGSGPNHVRTHDRPNRRKGAVGRRWDLGGPLTAMMWLLKEDMRASMQR